jgi:hypothetical protein
MAKPGKVGRAKKERNEYDEEVEDEDDEEDEDFDAEAEEASAKKKRRNVFVDDAAEEDGDEVCGFPNPPPHRLFTPHIHIQKRICGRRHSAHLVLPGSVLLGTGQRGGRRGRGR